MEEKILTKEKVEELGLYKIEVITGDMLEGYTIIKEYAFYNCRCLKSITIPDSVTSIEDYAFYECSSLTSVTIPNSVTSIGWLAFGNCSSLTSVTIPNSVTSIGNYAFYNVPNIVYYGNTTGSPWGAMSINGFVEGYLVYKDNTKTTLLACSSAAQGEISIPNSVTSIEEYAFRSCTGLTSVTIGNSVTSIGNYAFYNCRSLTSVTIPNSVTSIGEGAFFQCMNLKSVTIGNSVISIGKIAFYECNNLTSVAIPNSAKSIEWNAFDKCSKLKSITIGDKEYKTHKVMNGKCKAYKGFNANMACRDFQYKEGKTYEFEGEPKFCECGFHACLKLPDVFNYYFSKIGENFIVCEVELDGVSDEYLVDDSKIVAKRITIGKRIL